MFIGVCVKLIIAGMADRAGYPIRFLAFMLMAFSLLLMSSAISSGYVYLRYFL